MASIFKVGSVSAVVTSAMLFGYDWFRVAPIKKTLEEWLGPVQQGAPQSLQDTKEQLQAALRKGIVAAAAKVNEGQQAQKDRVYKDEDRVYKGGQV